MPHPMTHRPVVKRGPTGQTDKQLVQLVAMADLLPVDLVRLLKKLVDAQHGLKEHKNKGEN